MILSLPGVEREAEETLGFVPWSERQRVVSVGAPARGEHRSLIRSQRGMRQ